MRQIFRHKSSLVSGALSVAACLARYVEVEFAQHLPQICGAGPWPPPPIAPMYKVLSDVLSAVRFFFPVLALVVAIEAMSKREPATYTRLTFAAALLTFIFANPLACA